MPKAVTRYKTSNNQLFTDSKRAQQVQDKLNLVELEEWKVLTYNKQIKEWASQDGEFGALIKDLISGRLTGDDTQKVMIKLFSKYSRNFSILLTSLAHEEGEGLKARVLP